MWMIFDKNVHSALTCSASVTTAMTSSKPALAMTVVDSRLQKKLQQATKITLKHCTFFMFFFAAIWNRQQCPCGPSINFWSALFFSGFWLSWWQSLIGGSTMTSTNSGSKFFVAFCSFFLGSLLSIGDWVLYNRGLDGDNIWNSYLILEKENHISFYATF